MPLKVFSYGFSKELGSSARPLVMADSSTCLPLIEPFETSRPVLDETFSDEARREAGGGGLAVRQRAHGGRARPWARTQPRARLPPRSHARAHARARGPLRAWPAARVGPLRVCHVRARRFG